ncbi:MAG: argininosuccinate lyase [Bacteroidota bacterium]
MKLWQKGNATDKLFERFTIGEDQELDLLIAHYDVIGTRAHIKMLHAIGLLSESELASLLTELDTIKNSIASRTFVIEDEIEGCQSQIEWLLTRALGDVGKKIHTARSRNDQVLTALKLFTKAELKEIAVLLRSLFELLQMKSEKTKEILMPGYTHMQVAMPSSFGMWFGAHAESLVDDLIQLKSALQITDKNPLGSAAGFGSSFPIDRDLTTREMGFADLNYNAVYAQMTRGKMERQVSYSIANLAATLSKYCMDVCLFSGQNFDFFKLDTAFTTGSSIMPHKHNPDGFELVRAKCNQLQSLPYEMSLLTNNLPSGYHRDFQILKEHFLPSFFKLKDCLKMTISMTENLEAKESLLEDERYELLFTVEEVNRLVQQGIPFRDAYQKVGKTVLADEFVANKQLHHTHIGSIGNLANDRIKEAFLKEWKELGIDDK